ncbi:hypothetical protein [Petrachloros mirabilis]
MRAKTLLDLGCACETCRKNGGEGCTTYPDSVIPAETELDWPDCHLLVLAGVALPLDEECEIAANMTPRQMELAQRAARRAAFGIHPEDFEAFDSGEMIGYYEDGSPIPGPNAEESEEGIWLP